MQARMTEAMSTSWSCVLDTPLMLFYSEGHVQTWGHLVSFLRAYPRAFVFAELDTGAS